MGLGIERDSMFPENKISFKELIKEVAWWKNITTQEKHQQE
jgi:hypothetical protein